MIEFLGQLIANSPNAPRCIALAAKRQRKLKTMLEAWYSKRRRDRSRVEVEPRELATLLGHLVFASQCVPNGRTFMQNLLSSFKGLEVDWLRGVVKCRDHVWGRKEGCGSMIPSSMMWSGGSPAWSI